MASLHDPPFGQDNKAFHLVNTFANYEKLKADCAA
jgi:hypothetical protein